MTRKKDHIADDMKAAMRARDEARLSAIRMLLAAIQRREVDERITLDDSQVLAVIEKLVRQSRDAIEQFQKGGRADLAAKEERDIAVWSAYLPERLSDAELDALIAGAIAESGAVAVKDMGKVLGVLKPKVQGRADMAAVSAKVKAKLGA
jgi:hypothetical protein